MISPQDRVNIGRFQGSWTGLTGHACLEAAWQDYCAKFSTKLTFDEFRKSLHDHGCWPVQVKPFMHRLTV